MFIYVSGMGILIIQLRSPLDDYLASYNIHIMGKIFFKGRVPYILLVCFLSPSESTSQTRKSCFVFHVSAFDDVVKFEYLKSLLLQITFSEVSVLMLFIIFSCGILIWMLLLF